MHAIEAAQVFAESIRLTRQMPEGQKRGNDLGHTDDEIAFNDALEVNDSAVKGNRHRQASLLASM